MWLSVVILQEDKTNFDGCEVLKLSVWVLDDLLRLGPVTGSVNTDLVELICGEQLGAVRRIEIGWEEKNQNK